MKYRNKSDSRITCEQLNSCEYRDKHGDLIKCQNSNVVNIRYLTGPKAGKIFTMFRAQFDEFWEPFEPILVSNFLSSIDMEEVNKPYPEPKKKKYIPVPEAVVDYEEKSYKINPDELPTYEEICDTYGKHILKCIDKYKYIVLTDKSAVARFSKYIRFNCTEQYAEKLVAKGFKSKANTDKLRPFSFEFKTVEDYEKLKQIILDT